jgi:hypothetical protein
MQYNCTWYICTWCKWIDRFECGSSSVFSVFMFSTLMFNTAFHANCNSIHSCSIHHTRAAGASVCWSIWCFIQVGYFAGYSSPPTEQVTVFINKSCRAQAARRHRRQGLGSAPQGGPPEMAVLISPIALPCSGSACGHVQGRSRLGKMARLVSYQHGTWLAEFQHGTWFA